VPIRDVGLINPITNQKESGADPVLGSRLMKFARKSDTRQMAAISRLLGETNSSL
jgi:hypothetical protein